MKLFHLSDLHIGLKLYNRDMADDQRYILDEIRELAVQRKPDVILIAGDIYDRAIPSAEAVELFDSFLTGLTRSLPECTVMAISGNHDSPARINLFRDILSEEKIFMIGIPPMKEDEHIFRTTLFDEHGPVNFFLLPFAQISTSQSSPVPSFHGFWHLSRSGVTDGSPSWTADCVHQYSTVSAQKYKF